ncbi:MAG TPA: multiheme c-type cytochrome [Isosphaeraceae bacterium]|nr:multiheme c-type cytochrome [Isosphaeraceae bacterium]
MTKARGTVGMLAVAAIVAALWVGRARTAPAGENAPPPRSTGKAGMTEPVFVGTASCSGRACHGGIDGDGPKGQEFHVWARLDHHARAFEVLRNDRSRGIEKRLHPDKKTVATEDNLCLACHLGPKKSGPADEADAVAPLTGVGCESCHGAAGNWLEPHTSPGWKTKPAEQKAALGMQPLARVVDRVEACARCHVGDDSREVDHDLIAAGHPRLNFEFAAFQDDMPRHWKETHSEAESWSIGQVATARAALELLDHRTRRAQENQDQQRWPEFTEIDCFACHHDLHKDGAARQRRFVGVLGGRRPGAFPWGSWYFSIPRTLDGPKDLAPALDELAATMGRTRPEPAEVQRLTKRAIGSLDAWRKTLEASPPTDKKAGAWVAELLKKEPSLAASNWDSAAQLYLALAALGRDDRDREALARLMRALEFPKGTDSPGDFRAGNDVNEAIQALGAGRD